jgi:hypothetical protein
MKMAKSKAKNYYGVRKGRIPGVYKNWESCRAQVDKCDNQYRGFETYEEAEFFVATGKTFDSPSGKTVFAEWKCTKLHDSLAENAADMKRIPLCGISANNAEKKPRIKLEALDASQSYFSQVPNFEPNNEADFDEEFGRFASSQDIAPGSQAYRQQRTSAIRRTFSSYYRNP